MGFIEDWRKAIDADPYWQFEELLEKDSELAEAVWDKMRLEIIVSRRLHYWLRGEHDGVTR